MSVRCFEVPQTIYVQIYLIKDTLLIGIATCMSYVTRLRCILYSALDPDEPAVDIEGMDLVVESPFTVTDLTEMKLLLELLKERGK